MHQVRSPGVQGGTNISHSTRIYRQHNCSGVLCAWQDWKEEGRSLTFKGTGSTYHARKLTATGIWRKGNLWWQIFKGLSSFTWLSPHSSGKRGLTASLLSVAKASRCCYRLLCYFSSQITPEYSTLESFHTGPTEAHMKPRRNFPVCSRVAKAGITNARSRFLTLPPGSLVALR